MNSKRLMAMAVVGIMIASGLVLFIPAHQTPTLIAHISGITGTPYSGHGDYSFGEAITYDGVNLAVHGNILINGAGSLTIKNCMLTMYPASQWANAIVINAGFFKATNAVLQVSNVTAGNEPMVRIMPQASSTNVYISHSTLNHYTVQSMADNDWIDNCTMESSLVEAVYPSTATGFNCTGNSFRNLTAGFAILSLARNGVVADNTIYPSCYQTYSVGSYGWISTLTNSAAGTRILKNHIEATSKYVGIYSNGVMPVQISSNIIDLAQRNWNKTEHVALGACAGILVNGEGIGPFGEYSVVSYNIVKRVDAWAHPNGSHLWGSVGQTFGIAGASNAMHYNFFHNQIWFVGSSGVTWCNGIDYQGSRATISYNNISWVGCEQGPTSYNSAGIMVDGGMFITYPYFIGNAHNYEYVNVTYNTIDTSSAGTNGITFGWCYPGLNVTKGVISHNTLHTVIYGSGGIGCYGAVNNMTVSYNTITDVKHDSFGMGFSADVRDFLVDHNSIYVSASGGYNNTIVAIGLNFEGDHNSGRGFVISYNHIVIEPKAWSYYYGYEIIGLTGNTQANEPTWIIDEPSTFRVDDSSFKIIGDVNVDHQMVFALDNVTIPTSTRNGMTTYEARTPVAGMHIISTTVTYSSSIKGMMNLIIVFFALVLVMPVIGLVLQAKEKGISKEDLIGVVVGLVIGLIMLGIVVIVLGS